MYSILRFPWVISSREIDTIFRLIVARDLARMPQYLLCFRERTRMTKSELIEAVASRLSLPKGKAELVVNCVFDTMVNALQSGDGIEIRGFGSFTVRSYKAYDGRTPRTGEPVHVQPKKLPFFKVGKDLRERVDAAVAAETPPNPA
jgi:integration host factor subunit beta